MTTTRSRGARASRSGPRSDLPDDGDGVGQVALDEIVGHRAALVHDELAERLQARARGRVADHLERARVGVDEQEAHRGILAEDAA